MLFFAEYYTVIVLIPLFVGVFLKRTNKIAFWSSSIVGVGAFSILHLCTNLDHEAFLISFAASLVVYFLAPFITKKINPDGAFYKKCDSIIKRSYINNFWLAYGCVFAYCASLICLYVYGKGNSFSLTAASTLAACSCVLFFLDRFPVVIRNSITLSIAWYSFAFAPIYLFLYCKMNVLFVSMLLVPMVSLVALFSWKDFISLLLSGAIVASILFNIINKITKDMLMNFLGVCLVVGFVATVAFWTKRKEEEIRKLLKETKQEGISKQELEDEVEKSVQKAIDSNIKYQVIVSHYSNVREIDFVELRKDILKYFRGLLVRKNIKLNITRLKHRKIYTDLGLSCVSKLVFSTIFNVLSSVKNTEITLDFCHDENQEIMNFNISCKSGHPLKGLDYLKGCCVSYPQNILSWVQLKDYLERLRCVVKKNKKTFAIEFPYALEGRKDNIINFKKIKHKSS